MAVISLLYGSVRSERKGIHVAKYLHERLLKRSHTVHFIDPLEQVLPFIDKRYKEYEKGEAPAILIKLSEWFELSDGFLVVTAEYNHSIPPALKNILDHFQVEYRRKASAIACYSTGIFAGVRAADHMRIILGTLGMPAIPRVQPFPEIARIFDQSGNLNSDIIEKSTTEFIDEFEWYVDALKKARE